MTEIDINLRQQQHERTIPTFTSDIFRDNPDAQFATGVVGSGLRPIDGLEDAFSAYLRLRAATYIDEHQYLPAENKQADGTEVDHDDSRSTHFAVFENLGEEQQRVVGSMRVIHGGSEGTLPIEEYFPDFPYSTNHTGKTIEISRYISKHPDAATRALIRMQLLYPSVLSYVMQKELGPTYAVVDTRLEAGLGGFGVPLIRVSGPTFVPKYSGENVGILIDTKGLAQKIESDTPGAIKAMDFTRLAFSGVRAALTASK